MPRSIHPPRRATRAVPLALRRRVAPLVALALLVSLAGCAGPQSPLRGVNVFSPAAVHLTAAPGGTATGRLRIGNPTAASVAPRVVDKPRWLTLATPIEPIPPAGWVAIRVATTCGAGADNRFGTLTLDFGADAGETRLGVSRTCLSPDGGGFDVDLVHHGDRLPTASQQRVFARAAATWSAVITGDLEGVASPGTRAGTCGADGPALDHPVDDLVVFVNVGEIDGAGGVLGYAGPCRTRDGGPDDTLPWLGTMTFDAVDLEALERDGLLEATIVHEMGHVLGIGTLWERWAFDAGARAWVLARDLLTPRGEACVANDPHDVRFDGAWATAYHGLVGGDGRPYVEHDDGAAGTDCGHWDERHYGDELMTGYLQWRGHAPLSSMTIGSLDDLGYDVNYLAADPYVKPPRLAPQGVDAAYPIHLHERLVTPRRAGSP